MIAITLTAIGLTAAIATYYLRGFNEIVFSELPEGADEMQIVEYSGCGSLDHDSYPIVDGKVTMEWSYAIKTSHIRYRIVADSKAIIEANHSFKHSICHKLSL